MQGVLSVINMLGNTLDAMTNQNAALTAETEQLRRRVTDLEVELAQAQTAFASRSKRAPDSG